MSTPPGPLPGGRNMDPSRNDVGNLATRLAVARLRHTVGELQSQMETDRKLIAPVRKVAHLVVDDTALTAGIAEFKKWVNEGAVVITVPMITLDGLDAVKKGTDIINVNARESIRYFDRIQNGNLQAPGVLFQAPNEQYASWRDCDQFIVPGVTLPECFSPPPPSHHRAPLSPPTPFPPVTPVSMDGSPTGGVSLRNSPPRMLKNGAATRGVVNVSGNGIITTSAGGPGKMSATQPTSPQPINNQKNGRDHPHRASTFPLQMHQPNSPTFQGMNSRGTHNPGEPPRRIQSLLNCVLWKMHASNNGAENSPPTGPGMSVRRPDVSLVTNNPDVAAWARVYDINIVSIGGLEDMLEREDFVYTEKLREYEEAQSSMANSGNNGSPNRNNGRNGRRNSGNSAGLNGNHMGYGRGGSGGGMRGGMGGMGMRGGRGGGRGGFGGFGQPLIHHQQTPNSDDTEFVFVREAPRGVARGRGKLWEP